MKVLVTQSSQTLRDLMDCSPPASSVMEFSRQEYWSGLLFPSPGDLPDSGMEHGSPTLEVDSLPSEPPGKPLTNVNNVLKSKVVSLLFNMLYRFVIAFLPRSKHLLISCLQSLAIVILEPKKINSVTVSIVSPSICHEVIGLDTMILVF